MKVLSIKQPWGSVICSGLKHVENRSWGLKTLPLRILIHVGATKVPKDNDDYLPEEWLSLMRNARIMGLLPENANLPYSAIIGWADVVRCDEPGKNTSEKWAQNDFTGWVLENVHIFDEPILNVKGKLGIFDYPLEESELPPSHPAVFTDVKVENDIVLLPVNDSLWEQIEQGKIDEIQYDLTDENVNLFLKDTGEMQTLKTITLSNNGRTATYELADDTFVGPYMTPDETPYTFTSLTGEEGYEWLFILFVLGKKL